MGVPIELPLGVAACPLTATSAGIRALARRGYNVLTFKTVRSTERPAYSEPNWLYVRDINPPVRVGVDPVDSTAYPEGAAQPAPGTRYATVNSYGVQSPPPIVWQRELALALDEMRDTQLLIASVQGSPERYRTSGTLAGDFVTVARLAEASGATAIELNLSCPNVIDSSEGAVQPPICASPTHTQRIVESVRSALSPTTRLVAKLAYLPSSELDQVLGPIASKLDAVSGINTLQVRARDAHGNPVFPASRGAHPARDLAGLSGAPLRAFSQVFVRSLSTLRAQNGWTFDIIGMGGVSSADDVDALFCAGASAVQAATAVIRTPDLADSVASRGVEAHRGLQIA